LETDDGEYVEDAPDTPAPQFAIRALKSAFIGTPYAKQSIKRSLYQTDSKEAVEIDKAEAHPGSKEGQGSPSGRRRRLKNDLLSSPAKGILVTPGTAANKRKTVSFGDFAVGAKDRFDLFTGPIIAAANQEESTAIRVIATESLRDQEVQSSLTKLSFETQLEASKRRIGRDAKTQNNVVDAKPAEGRGPPGANTASQGIPQEQVRDMTIDLNVPFSRSGKHWKGEYDQYHRKSNREMRRLIQHGQTIKSYAQKKDSEATGLYQKLDKELAKVASMEARVSELAVELANVRSRGAHENIDPSQLMTDLAKQTATAIKSKQKAERYKAALRAYDVAEASPGDNDECVPIMLPNSPKALEKQVESPEMIMLRSELSNLRSALDIAEDKATKLQSENLALKHKMARVKVEMLSYEQRRLAREERLARKQAKLLAAKEASEAKLEELRVDHQQLRRKHQTSANERMQDQRSPIWRAESLQEEDELPMVAQAQHVAPRNSSVIPDQQGLPASLGERHAALAPGRRLNQPRERAKSPIGRPRSSLVRNGWPPSEKKHLDDEKTREPRANVALTSQDSSLNIWTYNASGDLLDDTLPSAGTPKDSDFSLLRRSTHAALQEISQNNISEQKSNDQLPAAQVGAASKVTGPAPTTHKLALSSAVRRMHSRRSMIASPRPSFLSMAPSAQKPDTQRARPDSSHISLDGKSTLLSTGTRTSSMGSRRALPPDRAEAAKKRLEAKRGEKKAKDGPASGAGI